MPGQVTPELRAELARGARHFALPDDFVSDLAYVGREPAEGHASPETIVEFPVELCARGTRWRAL